MCKRHQKSVLYLKMVCLNVGSSQSSRSGHFCHCVQEPVAPTASQVVYCVPSKEDDSLPCRTELLDALMMRIHLKKGSHSACSATQVGCCESSANETAAISAKVAVLLQHQLCCGLAVMH